MEELWTELLDFVDQLVSPDWGALIGLIPLLLLLLVIAYVGWVAVRFMKAGPRQRGGRKRSPRPPAGVHLPGPSWAPVFASVGLFVFLYGLVFPGPVLFVGTTILVLSLLYWLRVAIRDYDHLVHADTGMVAVVPHDPPPGVHLPGPSFRPILVSIALAVLVYGFVFGGWLLLAGALMVAISLLGWLADARAEYRAVVIADTTGHLANGPRPRYPTGTLWTFAFLFVAALILNAGILPPKSATGGTAGGTGSTGAASPGASASPSAGPPADVTITAQNVAFTASDVAAPAGRPFTIKFQNDDAGIPHNVNIHSGSVSGPGVFKGDIFPGVDFRIYEVPTLAAGTYIYLCDVHPAMTATLTAK